MENVFIWVLAALLVAVSLYGVLVLDNLFIWVIAVILVAMLLCPIVPLLWCL